MQLKLFTVATVFAACAHLAYGDAKSAASTATTQILAVNVTNGASFTTPWITVSTTQIQPPGGKDLMITFSAQTAVEYNAGIIATTGSAGLVFGDLFNALNVRILVDGVPAAPGVVTYDSQFRFLEAFLANPISACHETDPSGFVSCTFGQDTIVDILGTTSTHSFSFVVHGVSPQNHVVQAQVQFSLSNFTLPGGTSSSGEVFAVIGPRTLVVEQLQLDH
jgi:hypothetical protein